MMCNLGYCVITKDSYVVSCTVETTQQHIARTLNYIYGAILMSIALSSIFCCLALYYSVRNTIKKNQKYQFSTTPRESLVSTTTNHHELLSVSNKQPSCSRLSTTSTRRPNHETNSKELAVRTQAILYACTYWSSFLWIFMVTITGDFYRENPSVIFVGVAIIIYFFYPLQGFLNFLVYTRPRYLEYRKNEPDHGKFYAFRMSLTLQPVHVYQTNRRRDTMRHTKIVSLKSNTNTSRNRVCGIHSKPSSTGVQSSVEETSTTRNTAPDDVHSGSSLLGSSLATINQNINGIVVEDFLPEVSSIVDNEDLSITFSSHMEQELINWNDVHAMDKDLITATTISANPTSEDIPIDPRGMKLCGSFTMTKTDTTAVNDMIPKDSIAAVKSDDCIIFFSSGKSQEDFE
jgi:hypothetical protein